MVTKHADEQRRYRLRHPERKSIDRATAKQWKNEHPAAVKQSRNRWRADNPEKRAAHQSVYRALRRGTLVRQPCGRCGELNVHAHHHNGYAQEHWRDVVWLCPTHHVAVHLEGE